jgi:hypothetical protein
MREERSGVKGDAAKSAREAFGVRACSAAFLLQLRFTQDAAEVSKAAEYPRTPNASRIRLSLCDVRSIIAIASALQNPNRPQLTS